MSRTLNGSINLAKLSHVRMTTKKGAECLLIPIKDNLLEEDKNGNVYMSTRVIIRDEEDQYGQIGFVAKSTPSALYKTQTDAEKEAAKAKNPILGNLKDFTGGGDTPNAAVSGTVKESDGTDDLPF